MVQSEDFKALKIRWAKECDIPHLALLEKDCFDTYYREHRFNEADFTDYLHKKGAIFFVAVLNSYIVGYVAGLVGTSQSQFSAYLDSIAVLPKSRKRGTGDQLLQCFIEEAKQHACKRIMLHVATANEDGILFFSRRGFQKIRLRRAYYGKGLDGILMKLKI